MKELRFRQPVFNKDGTFNSWHYWGWISKGTFVSPLSMGHNVKGEFGQQFIGLHDKNGKEIFEGDVCKIKVFPSDDNKLDGDIFRTGDIQYHAAGFCITFHELLIGEANCYEINNFYDLHNKLISVFDFEVIGNIYEHHLV